MWKECNVVMLSTSQKAPIQLWGKWLFDCKDGEYSDREPEAINHHLYITSDDGIKEGDWYYSKIHNAIFQCTHSQQYFENEYKIIVTTDTSLKVYAGYDEDISHMGIYNSLPYPPYSLVHEFITQYNKGNVITKVLVEYKQIVANEIDGLQFMDYTPILKLTNNAVNTKFVKNNWTKEELPIDQMLNLIGYIDTPVGRRTYHSDVIEQIQLLKQWTEQNL